MRLIQKGNLLKGYEGEWQCIRCFAKWVLDTTDPEPKLMQDQRDGNAYHMPCPECGVEAYRAVQKRIDTSTVENYYNK